MLEPCRVRRHNQNSNLPLPVWLKCIDQLLSNRVRERIDFRADVFAQQRKSGDASQRDKRCGYCVLGKFQTGFITEKSLNHFVAPFRFD
jgi:hypothetical protein